MASYNWANVTATCVEQNSRMSPNKQAGIVRQTEWAYVDNPVKGLPPMIEPFIEFYRNPPPGCRCGWSSHYGQLPIRHIPHDKPMPAREHLVLWDDTQLWDVAQHYMQLFWEEMAYITRPNYYEDLYYFFDAETLWKMGAHNAWNLINVLVTHAHQEYPAVQDDWKQITDDFLHTVLYDTEHSSYNLDALRKWDNTRDIAFAVGFKNWPVEEILTFTPSQLEILREALTAHYVKLTGLRPSAAAFYPSIPVPAVDASPPAPAPASAPAPAEQTPVQRKGPLVVCGDWSQRRGPAPVTPASQTDTNTNNHIVTRNTPPSGPLTPVIEEFVPADTVTDDNKNTKTESECNINGLPIEQYAVDNHYAMKHGCSLKSAPIQDAHPILDDVEKSCAQKPASSEAPAALPTQIQQANPQQQQQQQLTVPMRGDMNMNMDVNNIKMGTRPVSLGNVPYISPQKDHLVPRHASDSNLPMYHHMMPPQHMVPNFGPPHHHGVMQGPVPFGPGHPPMHHNGPPPPGLGLGMGMHPPPPPPMNPQQQHMVPFHPPPPMGPGPQFDPSRGPIMNGPPMNGPPMHAPLGIPMSGPPCNAPINAPMAGPPIVGPPHMNVSPPYMRHSPDHGMAMRQQPSHGQFPHPGHHSRASFGSAYGNSNISPPMRRRPSYTTPTRCNRNKPGNRRNSSNGSATRKIGDDPLHGPVFALGTGRKPSNASSGRRTSNNGIPIAQGDGNAPDCNNHWANQQDFSQLFRFTFKECSCPRCEECTRGVYVKAPSRWEVEKPHAWEELKQFFQHLNPVTVRRQKGGWMVVFQNDLDAIRAIQETCDHPARTVPGWQEQIRVWYPLFSRHYYTRPDKANGVPWHLYNAQNSAALENGTQNRRNSNPFPPQQRPQHRASYNGPHPGNILAAGPMHQAPRFGQMPPPPPGPMQFNSMPPMQMQFAPMPPSQQQRKLWVPSPPAASQQLVRAPLPEFPQLYRMPIHNDTDAEAAIRLRTEAILFKEDWRSKPPSEEALEDDADDIAVNDAASVRSVRSGKSIKISLPSEAGSAREAISRASSRNASPEIKATQVELEPKEVTTIEEQEPPKIDDETPETQVPVLEKPLEDDYDAAAVEKRVASSRTMSPEPVTIVAPQLAAEQDKSKETTQKEEESEFFVSKRQRLDSSSNKPQHGHEKEDSGYRKTLIDLAAPVETLSYGTAKSPYRKTAADLHAATESPFNTIIHRPQPRSPLPASWRNTSTTETAQNDGGNKFPAAKIRGRFGLINSVMDMQDLEAKFEPKKDVSDQQQTAATQSESKPEVQKKDEQQKNQTTKKRKNKHNKKKAKGGDQAGAAGSRPLSRATTADQSTRGPSPAFSGPPSMTEPFRAPSLESTGSIKVKNNKRAGSESANGLAKGNGPQDTKGQDARDTTPQPESVQQSATAGSSAPHAAEKQTNVGGNSGKYRAGMGGSLRMEKNRAPKGDPQSLTTIFEPPVQNAAEADSPDSNIFADQKQLIDKMRRSQNLPPKTSVSASTKTHNDRNKGGLAAGFNPLPNAANGNWAAIAMGANQMGHEDDPFTDRKDDGIPANWKRTKKDFVMKKSTKPKASSPGNTPPSPCSSPEKKKAIHPSAKGKSQLNAFAASFTSSRAVSTPLLKRLNPTAQPFSLPPSPAMSIISAIEQHSGAENKTKGSNGNKSWLTKQQQQDQNRFITPAGQIMDADKMTEPAAPGRERKPRNGGSDGGARYPSNGSKTVTPRPYSGKNHNKNKAGGTAAGGRGGVDENGDSSKKTDATTATAEKMMDTEFPTLGEASAMGSGKRKGKGH